MFAVCRGKLSEGIDFSDDACRCVIMAGIPCAPIFNPDVLMKRQYIQENKEDPENEQKKQYFDDAKRQINQSIGRVIRHIDDYGVIPSKLIFQLDS